MRLFFSSVSFIATVVLGTLAFAATAIEFPGIMRDLIAAAEQLRGYLAETGLSDSYMVWVDLLISGDKIVLLGFIIATRVLLALLVAVAGPIFTSSPRTTAFISAPKSDSPFDKWG
jgi:hypothetical protein